MFGDLFFDISPAHVWWFFLSSQSVGYWHSKWTPPFSLNLGFSVGSIQIVLDSSFTIVGFPYSESCELLLAAFHYRLLRAIFGCHILSARAFRRTLCCSVKRATSALPVPWHKKFSKRSCNQLKFCVLRQCFFCWSLTNFMKNKAPGKGFFRITRLDTLAKFPVNFLFAQLPGEKFPAKSQWDSTGQKVFCKVSVKESSPRYPVRSSW